MAPNMDDMDPFGPRDLSIFDETVPQYPPFPDYCTCVIGRPESCTVHLGISDNFQPVPRIDAEFENLLTQPDSNQELQYPSTLSHFNAPPLPQTNTLMFGQQPQNAAPTHNFASLHLNPEQPPDPSVNVFGTYTPGDKLLPPEAYNSDIHGLSQLYVNQVALQEQYATPDSRSDPGPSIKPLQRTRTYAQAAALPKINTQLQGQGTFGAGMMQTPQTEFRIQPPNPNMSPSEPVEILTKPSSNIRLSIRSRGATCGSSRRRDKSPSVASTGTRRSITKRNYFRKTSNAANMFLTADSADLRCKFLACRKPFDNRSALHHHEMKHTPTEEKPFQCEYPGCGMGFLWDKDLVRHMTKHTKEKPFRCGICSNKSFSRHDNLRRHYINDHPKVDPPSTSSRTGTVNSSQS